MLPHTQIYLQGNKPGNNSSTHTHTQKTAQNFISHVPGGNNTDRLARYAHIINLCRSADFSTAATKKTAAKDWSLLSDVCICVTKPCVKEPFRVHLTAYYIVENSAADIKGAATRWKKTHIRAQRIPAPCKMDSTRVYLSPVAFFVRVQRKWGMCVCVRLQHGHGNVHQQRWERDFEERSECRRNFFTLNPFTGGNTKHTTKPQAIPLPFSTIVPLSANSLH